VTGECIDQLPGDAHLRARLAHRAFQDIADPRFAAYPAHINGLALVGEGRIAGDDEEPSDTRQRGDDLLDHAVGEMLLLRIAAHIGKGQHRDRRLVGKGKRRTTLTRLTPWRSAPSPALRERVDPGAFAAGWVRVGRTR
jgi:hypothetical protein